MLLLDNRTPHAARLLPWLDPSGVEHAVVVAKVALSTERGDLRPADEPARLALADEHYGAPEHTSVRVESDLVPHKAGADVVAVGSIHAQSPVTWLDVTLSVGPVGRVMRVVGDREWTRGPAGYQPSSPKSFTSMELTWERAFGGVDPAQSGSAHGSARGSAHDPSALPPGAFDERNPVGVGFASARARVEHHPLPNLEDAREPLTAPGGRPRPMAPGFVGRSWAPRARLGGTYDDAWRRERAPLVPRDLDPRYYQGAPADLVAPRPFSGGERVYVSHARPGGRPLDGALPACRLVATVKLRGERTQHPLALDTVVIDLDAARVWLTLRALVRCPKSFLAIERVRLDEVRG